MLSIIDRGGKCYVVHIELYVQHPLRLFDAKCSNGVKCVHLSRWYSSGLGQVSWSLTREGPGLHAPVLLVYVVFHP